MQPNFTRKRVRRLLLTPLLAFLCLWVGNLHAQTYTNGVLSSGATANNGTAAPAGFTWSECQNVTGNTTVANQLAGSSAQVGSNFSVADDFTVPAGAPWNLTKITVYAYSTNYTGTTSPFNDVRIRIHSSSPVSGPTTVVFGDLTTNRLSASSSAATYRIFNTLVPPTATGTTRHIWKLEAVVAVTLNPGTYWLEYQTGTALTSNFTPMSAPPGVRTVAGYNAIQRNNTTWAAIVDDGITQAGTTAGQPVAMDIPFQIDYNTGACTGTPTPGNTLSTAANVCPGTNFTLSLQNATPGSGVTYQWQSSPDGTTWTDIGGATGPTYSSTLTATTQFRARVTCSGNTGTSNPVTVTLNPPSACYCVPAASNCSLNDVILNVNVGGINNSSTCSAGPPTGYANYTTSVAAGTLYVGTTNPMSVSVGPGGTENVGVWIDYDKSGSFEASEFTLLGSGNGVTINGGIAVPASAPLGSTRMRVRVRFSTAVTGANACTTFTFGETEDYTVNLVPCVPAVFTTQPTSSSIQCGSNATFSVNASGSLPVYQWQFRPNSSAVWNNVTNGGVYSGATTNTLTLTNVPGTLSGYQYRALMTGGCSGTDFSNAATLTVTPIVATVSPTTAIICNGNIQQLTLTNASSPATGTFTNTTSTPIPDNTPAGMTSTIAVSGIPAGAVIQNISVTLNITHTYVGDLDINLIAPNGQNLNLVGALDGGIGLNGTDNFINTVISSTSTNPISGAPAPRTGTFAAEARAGYGPTGNTQTVTTWAGLTSVLNGNWRLAIADFVNLDIGTLNNWTITITYGAPAVGVWTATPAGASNTIFTDAAATVPYVAGTPVTSIYVKPTSTTNYSVVYNTATPCTSNPTTVTVTVANPVTGLNVTPATSSACIGGSTTFTANTTGGNPLTYQWQDSTAAHTWQNITGATSATYTLTNVTNAMTGKYRVIATAAPCTGSVTSAPVVFTANPIPTVTLASPNLSITPGQTTTITATSTPAAASYSWTLNGNTITGATGATVTASIDDLGSYLATVTDVNGCVGTAATALVIGGAESDNLWIYPNPTNSQFQVRLYSSGNPTEVRVVSLYSTTGQLLERKKFTLDNVNGPYLRMDFDLSKLASGIYVVKVEDRYSKVIKSGFVVKQ